MSVKAHSVFNRWTSLAGALLAILFWISGQACSGRGGPSHGPTQADIDSCGMSRIPEGCFDMGDVLSEGDFDELPVHKVCLKGFLMDACEVTNGAYQKCVEAGRCDAPTQTSSFTRPSYYGDPAYDNYPVIHVTWHDSVNFCTWVGKRLPTEAEWEYAARGGLTGNRYSWGDELAGSYANYWNSGDEEDNDTTLVGSYPPNGYGLYDMIGNVYEWVSDRYDSDYYALSSEYDPAGPETGSFRVVRGGSWTSDAGALRVSNRVSYYGQFHSYSVGFRCAK